MKNLLFSFEDMSVKDKAAKAIVKHFAKAGANVVSQDVDTKIRRTSGITYREMTLTFDDSQKVALRVKATGDIYQVLLNGKVIPIKNQDDHAKAVAEIAANVESNSAKFQRLLAKARIDLPKSIRTAAPKLEEVWTQKVETLREAVTTIKTELRKYGVSVEG